MKHPWFAFRHRKKTGTFSCIFIEILFTLFSQKQKRKSTENTIFDMNTKRYLNEYSHTDTLTKGVAEQ
ncbi:MAG: hypothetical protein BV459_06440 [Thermoplasmata archaeon M11B2D]|nr:MAG: hypothetical protein BV459_06440 [Thermoplasmata archaeon M11B2D]